MHHYFEKKISSCYNDRGSSLLFPTFYLIGRANNDDTFSCRMYRRCGSTIKVNDVTIPQGASICISIPVVHKNPLFWPEPNKFDPERYIVHTYSCAVQLLHIYIYELKY